MKAPARRSPDKARLAPSAFGAHTRLMRRLLALLTALVTAVVSIFMGLTLSTITTATGRSELWLLVPLVLVPALVAGGAAAVGMRGWSGFAQLASDNDPARSDTTDANAADRIWRTALAVLLVLYAVTVIVAAIIPVFPRYDGDDITFPEHNPLTNFYLAISAGVCVTLSTRQRFAYALGLAPLLAVGYPEGPTSTAIEEVLGFLAPSLGNIATLSWLLQQAALLDQADARRQGLLTELRIEESRQRARRLGDNYIHDHILSVLKAIPGSTQASTLLQRSAASALRSLDSSPGAAEASPLEIPRDQRHHPRDQRHHPRKTICSAGQLVSALKEQADAVTDGRAACTADVEGEVALTPSVFQAIVDAASEALRNAVAHAGAGPGCAITPADAAQRSVVTPAETEQGPAVTPTVRIRCHPAGVEVTVSDDGPGFDPERIGADRHGIRDSIVRRMSDVGGSARVYSAPGAGTQVALTWTAAVPTVPAIQPHSTAARAGGLHAPASHPSTAPTPYAAPGPAPGPPSPPASPLSLAACLQSTTARGVCACLIPMYCGIVAIEIRSGAYVRNAPVLAGLAAAVWAAYLILRSWPQRRMPGWAAAVVAAIAGGVNFLVAFHIDTPGWPAFAIWSIGTGLSLSCGLLARERWFHAWASVALIAASTAAWVLATGRDPVFILGLGIPPFLTLGIWHLIAYLSVAMTGAIDRAEAAAAEIAARRRAEQEGEAVMRRAMASVRRRVGPILSDVASGEPLSADVRAGAELLEAELRDERRARFFTGTAVAAAARAARSRGIEVILLDDSGHDELPETLRERVLTHAVEVLTDATRGRVVIRLLPPRQRPTILSIVADDVYSLADEEDLLRPGP